MLILKIVAMNGVQQHQQHLMKQHQQRVVLHGSFKMARISFAVLLFLTYLSVSLSTLSKKDKKTKKKAKVLTEEVFIV